MKKAPVGSPFLLLAAAALAVGGGVFLSARTVAQARAARLRIRALHAAADAVVEARIEWDGIEAMVSAFAPPDGPRETPALLFRRFFPGAVPETVEREALETEAGRFRRQEWLFDDAPAERVLAFAAACEAARPPWRVEEIRLSAVPGAEGRVRGGLLLLGPSP